MGGVEAEGATFSRQKSERASLSRQKSGGGLHEQALRLLEFPPLMIHVALVLIAAWIVSLWESNVLFFLTLGFVYLCCIESRQRRKIEMRIRSDERKSTDRKRLLSDAETARWLNNVVESIWPIFLNKFVSEHLLMRLAPWFLARFKPWTAKKILLQQFYMGSNPPVFTHFRAGRNPTDGDHLVLEMKMNFSAADDMGATLAVQMRKRLGFGIWTTFKVSELQIEGDVRIGIRFISGWPVIKRLRICFSEAPVIRMVAKPIFSHGVDVTDLPGIAAWLDKMVVDALENSLVEPNLLVVDVEQLVGDLVPVNWSVPAEKCSVAGDWFHLGQEGDVASLLVEILEAKMLKPCDPNGKADPYVKILLGQHVHTTTIKRKTLSPVWHEPFRIPIQSWIPRNPLVLKMLDKDRFVDDKMGYVDIYLDEFKDGRRHEMWAVLKGVKTGQLRVALTVENAPAAVGAVDGKPGIMSPVANPGEDADSRGELQVFSKHEIDERHQADIDETPLENEYENVDVGVGKSGCVSIVNPGRDVVNEAYSTERLEQRRSSSRKHSSRTLDRQVNKSGRQGDEMGVVNLDLGSPESAPEVKHYRISNLLGRRSRDRKKDAPVEDTSEVSEEVTELLIEGTKGTQLHTDLKMDEDDIEVLEACNFEQLSSSDDLPGEDDDNVDKHRRLKLGRGNIKRMGKGVLRHAGNTAQQIGHGLKRFSPSKSDRHSPPSFTEVLPMETSLSPNEKVSPSLAEGLPMEQPQVLTKSDGSPT